MPFRVVPLGLEANQVLTNYRWNRIGYRSVTESLRLEGHHFEEGLRLESIAMRQPR